MSEMVEKVAKAIAEHGGSNWESCLNAPGQRMAAMYLAMARAAIEAMRDAPPSVRVDKYGSDRWAWVCHVCGGPKENWERAIDAALKD